MENKERNEWLKILYVETWKEYMHEETIAHSKNTFFLSIHGALLAILSGVSAILVKSPIVKIDLKVFNPSLFYLSFLTAIIGSLALFINRNWKMVSETHRSYMNIRWFVA